MHEALEGPVPVQDQTRLDDASHWIGEYDSETVRHWMKYFDWVEKREQRTHEAQSLS